MSKCQYCGKNFVPDKYHPYQKACGDCQGVRQEENNKKWKQKNKTYFRYENIDTPWANYRREYLAKWRKEHPDYFKNRSKKRGEEK